MCRSTVAGAEVVKVSDALSVLLGFGVTVTALTVRGGAAAVVAAAVAAGDELSSDVHAANARDAATRHVSTAARPRIGGTLRQARSPIRAGREGPFA